MNELERAVLLAQPIILSPMDAAPAMLLAFALGLVIAGLYRLSLGGRLPPPALVASLAILPVISSLVLLVIGNSLARAFSLVGALAIVRFRTRLASPWDISFVFFSLAVGIACGVGALPLAGLGTAIIALAVLVLGAFPGTRPQSDLIVLRCEVAAWQCGEAQLQPVLQRHALRWELKNAQSLRFGETLSLAWRVSLKRGVSAEALIRELAAVEGVERVTLMNDESSD